LLPLTSYSPVLKATRDTRERRRREVFVGIDLSPVFSYQSPDVINFYAVECMKTVIKYRFFYNYLIYQRLLVAVVRYGALWQDSKFSCDSRLPLN